MIKFVSYDDGTQLVCSSQSYVTLSRTRRRSFTDRRVTYDSYCVVCLCLTEVYSGQTHTLITLSITYSGASRCTVLCCRAYVQRAVNLQSSFVCSNTNMFMNLCCVHSGRINTTVRPGHGTWTQVGVSVGLVHSPKLPSELTQEPEILKSQSETAEMVFDCTVLQQYFFKKDLWNFCGSLIYADFCFACHRRRLNFATESCPWCVVRQRSENDYSPA